jgi:CRISPR-associated protein Csm1
VLSSLEKGDGDKWLGIDALGVLKADVDDLALLFACGLPQERFTISRLYALSSQFNNFFAFYLPYALRASKDFNSIYTVFAGGDDLFLLGPWDKIIEFARFVHDKFKHYVCENEEVHFSAGISFVKSNMPVDIIAEYVEENLELAKNGGKNSITMFKRVVDWEQFDDVLNIREEINHLLSLNYLTKSTLYKLNGLIKMAEKEKKLMQKAKINVQDIHNLKWRALLSYVLARNIRTDDKEVIENIVLRFVQLIEQYRGDLIIPLWSVLYKQRKYN